ncbi:MFS transporter [Actinomadura sp. DC4]|uniref:MFS transporter n=1 Tax=Actinomadura sp. DC4 TaxID=3055069 RepID=UPI0025B1E542|nr:MFS transporter [Actinomadura sp. DC4]MDN3354226.1 MFS transporter [Actinomadura sp. DC4]
MDDHTRRAERLFIPAIFITSLGNNIQVIAASLLLVRTEKTMLAVGWLFIAVAIPQAVLSPFFGRLADRFDRRRLWFGCDLASAVAALALPLGVAAGGPRHFVIYGANFALAAVSALFVPASAALIKERVRGSELRRFNANYEIAMQTGMLLSASVGGFAVQWLGAMPLFVFNAGTFLASAACVFAMGRGPSGSVRVVTADAVPRSTAVPARTGRLILLYAQSSIVVTVFNALLPIFVIAELHRGSGILGVVDALGGLGFLLAAAAYRVISPRTEDLPIALAGFFLTGIVLVLQPQFGTLGLVPGVLVGAWVLGQARIASRALLLTSVPSREVGRVFGLANAYGLAGTVVVMLGVSAVTDHSDSRYGFASLAVITTVFTALVLVTSLLTFHRERRVLPQLTVPAEQTPTA